MENVSFFELPTRQTEDIFSAYVRGDHAPLFCAIGRLFAEGPAKEALLNSANVLGYDASCGFVRTQADEGGSLDARSLFMLVEGLDPRCIVLADAASVGLFAEAYRLTAPFSGFQRIFGRNVVAFEDFAAELSDERRRQKAWAELKKLPSLESR